MVVCQPSQSEVHVSQESCQQKLEDENSINTSRRVYEITNRRTICFDGQSSRQKLRRGVYKVYDEVYVVYEVYKINEVYAVNEVHEVYDVNEVYEVSKV